MMCVVVTKEILILLQKYGLDLLITLVTITNVNCIFINFVPLLELNLSECLWRASCGYHQSSWWVSTKRKPCCPRFSCWWKIAVWHYEYGDASTWWVPLICCFVCLCWKLHYPPPLNILYKRCSFPSCIRLAKLFGVKPLLGMVE